MHTWKVHPLQLWGPDSFLKEIISKLRPEKEVGSCQLNNDLALFENLELPFY